MARTRGNVDFLRKIGENTKPLPYGAGDRTLLEPVQSCNSKTYFTTSSIERPSGYQKLQESKVSQEFVILIIMKLLISITLLLLLVIIGLFLYTWYRLHVKVNLHAESSKRDLPTGWKAETQYVTNSDSQKIAYWYFPVNNPKAVVILIHGYRNPGGKAQMLGHAEYLHDARYSTVLLDLRSFGESEGNKITLGIDEWKDVETVFDQIKSLPENKDKKIGFLGISMGGVTAIMISGKTQKGDFVVASVPYANSDTMFHAQIKTAGFPPQIIFPFMKASALIELGKEYEKFAPSAVIKDIKAPILLISAKQDEELNSQDAKSLYDLANQPKEYWEIDSHHDIFDEHPQEFKEKVLSFLQEYVQ